MTWCINCWIHRKQTTFSIKLLFSIVFKDNVMTNESVSQLCYFSILLQLSESLVSRITEKPIIHSWKYEFIYGFTFYRNFIFLRKIT